MLNFLGIGAQKCGTTWLYDSLAMHPHIRFPAGKEIHYWNRPQGRSIDWYVTLFKDNSQINGDITPAYAFLPKSTIGIIHSNLPDLRLIYLIRNPIERAWSSARMALALSEMLHEEASDQWFIDHFKSAGSLLRGDYETCLRQWRSFYHSDQLLVIRYDDVVRDPVGVINRCLSHLGIERHFEEQDCAKLSQPVFQGDGVPLRPSLHRELLKIYSDRLLSLSQYLEEDISSWNCAHQQL